MGFAQRATAFVRTVGQANMWKTSQGDRILEGSEADLVRKILILDVYAHGGVKREA